MASWFFPRPWCAWLLPGVCPVGRRPGAPAGGPPGGAVGRALPSHLRPPPHLTGHAEPDGPWGPGQGGQQLPLGGGEGGGQGPGPTQPRGHLLFTQFLVRPASSAVPGPPCSQKARACAPPAPSHVATKARAVGAADPRLLPPCPALFRLDLHLVGLDSQDLGAHLDQPPPHPMDLQLSQQQHCPSLVHAALIHLPFKKRQIPMSANT